MLSLGALVGCATSESWDFIPEEVISIELRNGLTPGKYDIYPCSKQLSEGSINISTGEKYDFCAGHGIDGNLASLEVTEQEYEICMWREIGFCVEGSNCDRNSVLDHCMAVKP